MSPKLPSVTRYENLSDAEIDALITALEKLKVDRAREREAKALAALRKLAEEQGLSPEVAATAFLASKPKKKRPKSGTTKPPKYRGPNGETWAGTGKQPTWLREAIANGAELEAFRIDAGGSQT